MRLCLTLDQAKEALPAVGSRDMSSSAIGLPSLSFRSLRCEGPGSSSWVELPAGGSWDEPPEGGLRLDEEGLLTESGT